MTAITNIQGFRTQDCLSHYAPSHPCESKVLDDKVSRLGNELLMLKTVHGGFISADKKAQLLEQGVSKEDLNSIEKNRARLLGGMPPKKQEEKQKGKVVLHDGHGYGPGCGKTGVSACPASPSEEERMKERLEEKTRIEYSNYYNRKK